MKITLRWETKPLQRMWAINGYTAPTIEFNKSTTLPVNSPVVLVAGPGPDGKLVTKPPEGTWIIINPRAAGLHWLQTQKFEKKNEKKHSHLSRTVVSAV